MKSIVCVLRSGGVYGRGHVLDLAASARQFDSDVSVICFSDVSITDPSIRVISLKHNLPGWFSKLEIFSLIDFPFIYVDLDVVITGKIDVELPKGLYMLRGFGEGDVNSSVMYVNGNYKTILDEFLLDVKGNVALYSVKERWGDQDYIRDVGEITGFLQDLRPGLAASWKKDLRYQLGVIRKPPTILVFHGKPKPEDLSINYLDGGGISIFSWRYFFKSLVRFFY